MRPGRRVVSPRVDDFGGGRMCDSCADFLYCLALNENFAGGDDASGFDVEQAGSVEDDRVRGGRGLRLRRIVR